MIFIVTTFVILPVGLLDRPVEVSGCRARKKVERLEIGFTPKERSQAIEEGAGKKLGECPRSKLIFYFIYYLVSFMH